MGTDETQTPAAAPTCALEHEHAASGRCYTHHGCRCAPCTAGQAAYQRALRRQHAREQFGAAKLPRARVDGRGTRRRLQALVARGWSMSKLARFLEVQPTNMPALLQRERVTERMRGAVADLYERLWATKPPAETVWDRRAVVMALRLAGERGWVPPLAWDDIDADEEPATGEDVGEDFVDEAVVELALAGERPQMSIAERRAVVAILHEQGHGDYAIGDRIGLSWRTSLRDREALGLVRREESAA